MDQKTRKLMSMNKALHPRDVIDYMCQEKKEEEDSLAIKIALMHRYKDFIKKVLVWLFGFYGISTFEGQNAIYFDVLEQIG